MAWKKTRGKQLSCKGTVDFLLYQFQKSTQKVDPRNLKDRAAYESARRTGLCLRFLDIDQPNAPKLAMFTEQEKTRLPRKISRMKQQTRETPSQKKNGKPKLAKEREGNQSQDKQGA